MFRQAGIKKVDDRLADLDVGKIRMGWIKQVIVLIGHNDARNFQNCRGLPFNPPITDDPRGW